MVPKIGVGGDKKFLIQRIQILCTVVSSFPVNRECTVYRMVLHNVQTI